MLEIEPERELYLERLGDALLVVVQPHDARECNFRQINPVRVGVVHEGSAEAALE
jgi:hypothetical protein